MDAQISRKATKMKRGWYEEEENAEYFLEEVNDSISFTDSEFVATRCYVKSPFNNENAIYFGGFDPNGFLATNKAWIYKNIIS